jgi:D-lactate dehydrogenase (cytochrome)
MSATPISAARVETELRALLGKGVLDSGQTAPLLVDQRGLYRGRPLAVVQPASVAEVAAVLRWAHGHGIGVVPQGGNTGYCGGATPDESGRQLLLLLRGLNRIREVDAENFSLTAEAGCTLAQVQQAAAAVGRLFPLSLGSEHSCQIGGNLATNAGGLNVLRYGMTRDLTLGVEAVLADGRIYEGLNTLRKDNTGYDLTSLLIGSEGTLAVITAAALKLWPATAASATAMIGLRDVPSAIQLLALLQAAASSRLTSFELMPRTAVDLASRYVDGVRDPLTLAHPWYLLCELRSSAAESLDEMLIQALGSDAAQALIAEAALAVGERQRADFWRLRESVPAAQRRAGASLKHDISVPLTAVAGFIDAVDRWVAQEIPDGMLVCYGHAGDGNLHCNVSSRPGVDLQTFRRHEEPLKRFVHDTVASLHGSISAEHGIGRLKVDELQRYAPPVELALMRRIKQALDPSGIMNPGKVL